MNPIIDAFTPSPETLAGARERLALAARDADLVDVAHTTVDTPVGPLLLAATRIGLVYVGFDREDRRAVMATLAERISPRIVTDPERLAPVAAQLDEYFAGRRTRFDLALDFSLSSGFRGRIQRMLSDIGYGETRTYRDLAALAGNPGAVRAVGSACATNPLPVVVPCHRVLRSDGSLGGYRGGLEAKATLLALERAA